MLIVPVLSLGLYSLYALYSFDKHQKTKQHVAEISNHYLPLLNISHTNKTLFNNIRDIRKDAAIAGEASWLKEAETLQNTITTNINKLWYIPVLIDKESLISLKESFDQYNIHSQKLAELVIADKNNLLEQQDLVANVERYHNHALIQFSQFEESIIQQAKASIDQTNQVIDDLLMMGSVIVIALLILLVGATLLVSLSTYKSLSQVILAMKSLAERKSDFSQRMHRTEKDEIGELVQWFNALVDKLEQNYTALQTISITDKLTQLNNRNRTDNFFPLAIQQALESGMQLSCAMIDVDHFKQVNDTYGHQVGDEVLKQFAQILKTQAAKHDFIGRWGGEEFILIIPFDTNEKLTLHLEDIRNHIATSHFPIVDHITASFGSAILKDNDTPDSMIKRADILLYQAKEQGRNCVVVES